jgi:hypothetical protein
MASEDLVTAGDGRSPPPIQAPPPNAKSTELIALGYWPTADPAATYPISIGALASRSKLGSTGLHH